MLNKNLALRAAGVIFSLAAFAHLVRLLRRIPIILQGMEIPVIFSLIAIFVTLALAIWMFSAAAKK